jgi:DNA-directed RNA polymerase subunit M/transcription elongation factor TFIIS
MNWPNLKKVATQPHIGWTAAIDGEPYLVLGMEDGKYVLEGENGVIARRPKVDWLEPDPTYDVNDRYIAASRMEGSPLAKGRHFRGHEIGNLVYTGHYWKVEEDVPVVDLVERMAANNWEVDPSDDRTLFVLDSSQKLFLGSYSDFRTHTALLNEHFGSVDNEFVYGDLSPFVALGEIQDGNVIILHSNVDLPYGKLAKKITGAFLSRGKRVNVAKFRASFNHRDTNERVDLDEVYDHGGVYDCNGSDGRQYVVDPHGDVYDSQSNELVGNVGDPNDPEFHGYDPDREAKVALNEPMQQKEIMRGVRCPECGALMVGDGSGTNRCPGCGYRSTTPAQNVARVAQDGDADADDAGSSGTTSDGDGDADDQATCPQCGHVGVFYAWQGNSRWHKCKHCGQHFGVPKKEKHKHSKEEDALYDQGEEKYDDSNRYPKPLKCPNCQSHTVKPLLLEKGKDSTFYCQNCGNTFKHRVHVTSSVALDTNGNPLSTGGWYLMYSTKYTVPDVVKILGIDNQITATLQGDDKVTFPIEITPETLQTEGYTFEPFNPNDGQRISKIAKSRLNPAQQRELIDEGTGERARNLAKLRLEGTHYAIYEEDDEPKPFFW